jgi:hypothetical protein
MIPIKALSLPLASALFTATVLPAVAQVSFDLSSKASYRQTKKNVEFRGGRFDAELFDGSGVIASACSSIFYYGPGAAGDCSPGTTGLITSGSIRGVGIDLPYITILSLNPAIVVEPKAPERVFLNAAPASSLERPTGGFKDDSFSVFYNLSTTDITEYIITHYFKASTYSAGQDKKFRDEIVPGVYYYSFPRLGRPELNAAVSAVIYPIVEGYREVNHIPQGFRFTQINQGKWNKKGFVELSYLKPNTFKWSGITPAVVYSSVDKVYFSIKGLQNYKDPKSEVVERYAGAPISVFPPFQNAGDPQIILNDPYKNSFTTPPIFDSGTAGVAQIQVKRDFQTGGVTYDKSSRTFQIPVIVVNRYTDYQDLTFRSSGFNAKKNADLLSDSDNDGYNNLNEWILDSNGSSSESIPLAPVAEYVEPLNEFLIFGFPFELPYFGFDVKKKLSTVPSVAYTLQRSLDGGKTWSKFKSDGDWSVTVERNAPTATLPASQVYKVRSLSTSTAGDPIQPPGTAGHLYRVKITLKKKKK